MSIQRRKQSGGGGGSERHRTLTSSPITPRLMVAPLAASYIDNFSERSPQVMTLKLPRPAGKNSGRWMALGLARQRKGEGAQTAHGNNQTHARTHPHTYAHTQKQEGGGYSTGTAKKQEVSSNAISRENTDIFDIQQ